MGELLLASVNNVDVMVYDENTRQWIRPDDHAAPGTASDAQNCSVPDVQRLSHVQLLQNNNAYKIVAVRLRDHKVVLNQVLSNHYHRLKYKEANPLFHQWRNEFKQVIGLSFPNEPEAKRFYAMVRRSLEGGFPNQTNNPQEAVYQDMYQDPQNYYQQQQQAREQQPSNNYHYINNNQKQNSQSHQSSSQPQMTIVNNRKTMDPDRDSLGSANGLIVQPGNNHVHRKSSQPLANSSASPQQPVVVQNHHQQQHQVQRRSSQGSNNSSGTNSSGNSCGAVAAGHIYASACINGENGTYSSIASANSILDQNLQHSHSMVSQNPTISQQQIPVPPPPPPPPMASSNRIPPISSNAPPPPPPPPPGSLKNLLASNKGLSLADQLKQTQLRKASAQSAGAVNNRTSCNSSASTESGIGSSSTSSKTSTISSTNSSIGGQSDLLSELTDRLNRRKITSQTTTSPSVVNPNDDQPKTSIVNNVEPTNSGSCTRVPWQKSTPSINNACNATPQPTNLPSTSNDSPRVHRKAPSGSSLSSQEETTATNSATNSKTLPALNSQSAHAISSTSNNTPVTVADLETFKKGLLLDFQHELAKAKDELLLAFREIVQQQNNISK